MDILASLEIRRVSGSELPQRLLLAADESREAVADYVDRGWCYGAFLAGRMVGEYVLLHTRPFTAEVVNIAVEPAVQRQGIGGAMLRHAAERARAEGALLFVLLFVLMLARTGWRLTPQALLSTVVGWLLLCAVIIGVVYLVVSRRKTKGNGTDGGTERNV